MRIRKVLVLEDDRELATLIKDFLNTKGYEVILSHDATDAIVCCRRDKPDLVTVDLLLPNIEGLKFLEVLHNDPEISSIPVIIVPVVKQLADDGRELFHLGLVDWLKKPFDFDELQKIIENLKSSMPHGITDNNKIALIEDDAALAETTADILAERGYNVVRYTNGNDILENIRREKPFLILTDILLGDINGIDIVKLIKSNPDTSGIMIMVVSAIDIYELRRRYLLAGATEYFVGSFSTETFLNELHSNIVKYEMTIGKRFARILVADDDPDLANMIIDNLKNEGFDAIWACNGEEAVRLAFMEMPDLILLDISMPKKDGYQVFREIKADILLKSVPIIMLTAKGKTREKVLGLELGADDYVTKPYDLDELIARIRMVIRRTSSNTELNPLTKLPGNVSIEQVINDCIKLAKPFAVLYIDINNFKAYNDYYGFSRGDEAIRATARCVLESLNELGWGDDFVGHIGGDDFIVVTAPEKVEPLCKRLIEKYDTMVPALYDTKDRKTGFITTKDRQGALINFPLMSIAIGVATTGTRKLTSVGEVAKIGSEMKSFAKRNKEKGSLFEIDRRKE